MIDPVTLLLLGHLAAWRRRQREFPCQNPFSVEHTRGTAEWWPEHCCVCGAWLGPSGMP